MEKKSTFQIFFPGLYFILFVLLCILVGQTSFADDLKTITHRGIDSFHKAYNDWDEKEFQSSLNLFINACQAGPKDGLAEYWAGTVYFFLSQHNLFTNEKPTDKDLGIENAKKGIEILTQSIKLSPEFSESYALRGVLRGILIKMKPFSVFKQGRKVGKDRDKALALDGSNPRVHYLTGVSFWHAPEILGGRDKALDHLLEAEKLFEKEKQINKDILLPSWGHSACLAFIGDIYRSQNQNSSAFKYYKKALDVNPADPLAFRGLEKLETGDN